MARSWLGLGVIGMGCCVGLASCSDRWFAITEVSASSSASTVLHVGVDGCAPSGPAPRVTESDTEVHLLVSQRHGGDERACLSAFEVRLAEPIGSRKVIDDRFHKGVQVTLALPFVMPAPSWLPDGWTLQQETAAVSTYGAAAVGPSVSISLSSLGDALERFRGAPADVATTVQGRSAIWARPADQPAASALIVHDDQWTLVVLDMDSTVGRETVERIANSLTPFPFPTTVAAPTLPAAWAGSVADVIGKSGKATVTGWLVIDSDGNASLCDRLDANAHSCTGPIMTVDWSTGNSKPPEGLVVRGDSRVSDGPITLTGTAKFDMLFVGL